MADEDGMEKNVAAQAGGKRPESCLWGLKLGLDSSFLLLHSTRPDAGCALAALLHELRPPIGQASLVCIPS